MARLLVVDDERDIRVLFATELEEAGHQVQAAGTIQEAVDLLQKIEFDLVVLDIQMKGESGLDLLQKIVKAKEGLPVILCSAYSCYKEDFSSWLADAYVIKSSDLSELKGEVKRVLEKRAL